MKQTRILMGMPITVEIADTGAAADVINAVYAYFAHIDEKFSTYKGESEISLINKGLLSPAEYSDEMKTVLALSEETKNLTGGYFDICKPDGSLDPSGLVKGWSILRASELLKEKGFKNFYVEAGGDIQTSGKNVDGKAWSVGIRNPFNLKQIVKVLHIADSGVATSGTYIRGQHIYDPHKLQDSITGIVSLTVVGPDVYEADRFATACFAMGKAGITFIEKLEGFEGYMIDRERTATYTSGFEKYTTEKFSIYNSQFSNNFQ